jgi:tetratricopeptide (TPR) repeat protein
MIGRERQRELLAGAFANVVSERSCHLFTILGAAGVGKSRLAQEFLAGVDAMWVHGRCLSYGEGISYWPVTEVVKQLVPDGDVAGPLASILGDEAAGDSPTEIAWAFRKLLESRAVERPLVVVFDDLHWGEPTFLDLVEHVADLSRDAPILLLCMARPELLDARPTWGGGKLNATNVLLEPLGPEETSALIAALDDDVAEELRERIVDAAGGNPLFVEEMLAMANEGEEVAVPPTIQALLAARLDQLDPAERGVLERGAVEGQVFHRGAVLALAPSEQQVDGQLVTLVRKDLVRPEPALLPNDDAYRFRHLLIRDTAYDALPKATRAELHERFAVWLDEHGADLVELDEIVGYHFEHAYRYRAELGPLDEAATAVAELAGARLLASADRAQDRGDVPAAVGLVTRALELLPAGHSSRPRAQLELAIVLANQGEFDRATALRAEVESAARAAGDDVLLVRCRLAHLEQQIQNDASATIADALVTAEESFAEFERLGDEEGAIWALRMMGNFTGWLGNSAQALEYWRRALERAERAGARFVNDVWSWILWASWWGPPTTEETLRLCEEVRATTESKRVEAHALIMQGAAKGSLGLLEEGRADIGAGRGLLRELGDQLWWAGACMVEGEMELMAGNAGRAAALLAQGREVLAASAETGYLSTVMGVQAHAAVELGRDDEALAFADETRATAQPDDFEPHGRERFVRAQVLARRGDLAGADELIAAAAELIEPTDYIILHIDLAFARAEVAGLAGRPDEQRAALEQALSVAEAKGDLVAADRARRGLASL